MDPSINSNSHWKLPHLEEEIENKTSCVAILAVIEPWLKKHITDAQVNLPNYQTLRSDRKLSARGGAMLYIHNTLPTSKVNTYDDNICEAVICNIDSENLIVAAVYRPPNTPEESFKNMLNFLQTHISKESNQKHKDLLILGDFNLPCIRWNTSLPASYQNKIMTECADILKTFMDTNMLTQYIHQPTRLNNILDLVLSNNSHLVKHVEIKDTELSDHRMVTVQSNLGIKPTHTTKPAFIPHTYRNLNIFKANFNEINKHLEAVDWDSLHSICPENDFPELVRLTVLQICELHSPTKCYRSKTLSKFKRERRALDRKKRKLNRRLEDPKSTEAVKSQTKNKLVEIHDENKKLIYQESSSSEKEAIKKIRDDPRYFFSWSNRKKKLKTGVGPLLDKSGVLQHDDKTMADLLQDQFCSVFSNPENPDKIFNDINVEYDKPLEDITITPDNIDKAIKEIRIHSSGADDDIPAILIKKCSATLNYPFQKMWQDSLNNGYICQQFKKQIICPIYKKGSKASPANYRPVCPISHTIKTCERVVRDKIVDHLERNNLLCSCQHGFRKGRSCLSQLLHHIDIVHKNFLDNKDTDCIYLDYAKAFDKVDHQILLHKLKCYGITGKLLAWIKAFLSNRTQCVSINGTHSYSSEVRSGVPQGTVLGPILFLIFINDIDSCINHSFVSSFADDTRVKKAISTTSDVKDLQEDLNSVVKWSIENNMILHQDKFEYVNHSTGEAKLLKELPFNNEYYQYTTPDGTSLSPIETVRDLGVQISSDLSWSPHIETITDAARQMSAWILSVFESRDEELMLTLYKSLIRSRLEFSCPLWSPTKVEDIVKLEQIQRQFTSKISGYKDLHYHDRLKLLNLMSLQRRRERYYLLYLHKMLHGVVPNDIGVSFRICGRRGLCADIPPIQRHSKAKFQSKFDSSFSVLAPRLWNTLPKQIRGEEKFEKFKSSLTRYLLSIPDEPPIQGVQSDNSLLQLAGLIEGHQMSR